MSFIRFPFRKMEAQKGEENKEGWSKGLRLGCKDKFGKVYWGQILDSICG